jgi:hypothetical protein
MDNKQVRFWQRIAESEIDNVIEEGIQRFDTISAA